jgi:hypothetical protein
VNLSSSNGGVSVGTYIGYMAIMLVGACLSLLLRPLDQVVRADGSRIELEDSCALGQEVSGMMRLLLDPRVLALLPLFIYTNWMYAYQFTCFNSRLFTARTQGLNDAFYWGLQMLGSFSIGAYLDWQRPSPRQRAMSSLMGVYAIVAISWILGVIANVHYNLDGSKDDIEVLDFSQSTASWLLPFFLYCMWGMCDSLLQCWAYWVMGQIGDSPEMLSRFAGIYKFGQCIGAVISWVLSSGSVLPSTQLWINIGLFVVALPGAAWSCSTIGQVRHTLSNDKSVEQSHVDNVCAA